MIRRRTQAVYVISVAAELAGMHPQTLRIYERRGLVSPARTQGGNRRYSDAEAANAMVEAERRQRRDLVPLRQAVAVFGEAFPKARDDD